MIVGILALYGVAMQNYEVQSVSYFEGLLIEVLAPIQRGTLSFKERVTYLVDHYINIVNTSKENEQLRKTVLSLENEIFKQSEIHKENQRLKQLLQFGEEIKRERVLAQIVSWGSSSEFKILRINKGGNHGLKPMSPVITTTGLVGYVYKVGHNYSDILTILDQNSRVDTLLVRTRTHGIVEGRSNFKCSMKYVSRTEELNIGDAIITAGLGEVYPKGIKVGTVSKIDKKNYGITQDIEITPSVDFHKLEEVVVLVNTDVVSEVEKAE